MPPRPRLQIVLSVDDAGRVDVQVGAPPGKSINLNDCDNAMAAARRFFEKRWQDLYAQQVEPQGSRIAAPPPGFDPKIVSP